ncbi:hypothetical protein BT96DRAFT_120793 [Gymnopus androsaceus JB14]|uniref:Chitin synthase export chaperone n=1 Tax=Gymnopus androsaceus JB14 TaxID=1447944 RepID=A0A6A4HE71_9AGAR|nr:hypothetical protein BT96DRAFT_120793 [Gymnopus androsaceus JB14]
MTPEESKKIALLGSVSFQNISDLIFSIALFGVYILAFIISMHIISQRKNNGRAHKALIALLLVGFVILVLATCADIAANLSLVKYNLMVSLSTGIVAQEMAANLQVIVVDNIANCSANINVLIADIAIVWRAWALWVENRLIKWALLIILLLDICISIVDSVADTKKD